MKIGLQINRFTWPGEPATISETLSAIAQAADSTGFSSLWVMDHFFQIGFIGKPEEPMMEAYTTLGYLAALTKNVRLGTMVTGVIYREPALLLNAVTTLDVLSRGRAYLGIGAAWNEEESRALGFTFPPLKERFERLEETLKIAKQMFANDHSPFTGTHYQLGKPMNYPSPISMPHPPILIGGGGEKKTLRLVAQYADACNLFDNPELEHKLQVLKDHCQDLGRNYDEIEKTVLSQIHDTSSPDYLDTFTERCKHLHELGIQHVITSYADMHNADIAKAIGESVVPAVSKL